MKTRKLAPLLLAALLSISPALPLTFAAESISSHSDKPHVGLTTDQRNLFLNQAENNLKSTAKVTAAFWPWLKKHPMVRAGLLTSADPVPPVYAENLDHLRIALGPAISERYSQLLLGVSLTDELQPTTATGGDGAYNASAFGSAPLADNDPRVTRVVYYLKQKGLTLENFVAQMDSILSTLHLQPLKKKEQSALIDNVAYATKTYPPRIELPLVACLKKLVGRYETRIGPFNDKGPEWPLFPIDLAPYPLLAPLRQTLPERELDFLWDRFNGRMAGVKDRLPTYGHYTFDYDKPEIKYKQSEWNPNSLPRIIEDGGVCGRLSTLAQLSAVGLGRPAVGMYQPGHRALLTYHADHKTGHYVSSMDQAITGPATTTNQWYMPPVTGLRVNPGGKVVGVEWHYALTLSMNLGLDRYIDSRICVFMANRQSSNYTDKKIDLLHSATDLNPYNLEAWYALASVFGTDTSKINLLLLHMDSLLVNPDSGMSEERQLAANTDLSHISNEAPDIKKQSNVVASMLGSAIVESVYKVALKDESNAEKNMANLKAEIARRAAMKLVYTDEVYALAGEESPTPAKKK